MTDLDEIRKRKDRAMQNEDGLDAAFDLEEIFDDLLRIATEQEAELAEAATLMKVLVDVVDAHDIDSLSCDRDGKEYCDCLSRAVGHIQGFLARQEAK